MDTIMLGVFKSMIEKSGTTINNISLKSINGYEYLVFDMVNNGENIVKQVMINELYPKIIPSNVEPANAPNGTIWVVTE